MGSSVYEYIQVLEQLKSYSNVPKDLIYSLASYTLVVYQSEWANKFSEPMPWVGMYITSASLYCILSMAADLLHGFTNKKFWFPCKYFTLNAASLTVIAIAIKLPMDLTTLMPGYVDQAAKLGSLSCMCTMMANLLPSLATMNSKELVSNIIALGVLVITLVVNVCIQINTGVISYHEESFVSSFDFEDAGVLQYPWYAHAVGDSFEATVYVGLLLMLLIIYACSSLAILKSKQILESKYQVAHHTTLKDQELQQPEISNVEKLKQHVSNYWIMAGTGNPQFMIACSATTSASGVICALSFVYHILIMIFRIHTIRDYKSDYKWLSLVILITQFTGVILGAIAPISRCFAALSFKVSLKWIVNRIKVSNVESYWTQTLDDWKQSSISFTRTSRKCKIVHQSLKNLILSICIGFQKTVVVACKMITVIPIFSVICVVYCLRCWKWLKAMFGASGINLVQNPEQFGKDKDLSMYVLQLQDDMKFAERTLKEISKSVICLIQKAEKQQPKNLMKLLAESRGFEGVENFDSHHVPPLLSKEYLNCWSLSLVTLTSIAMSLPNIQNNIVTCLLNGVNEGLAYVTIVEESLNFIDEHVILQKAARTLWVEVEVYHKWLGNKLPDCAPKENTTEQILQWLSDTSKNIVSEVESTDSGVQKGNSKCRSISANSMYRITETLLRSFHETIEQVSQEELFAELLSIIADILAACLTNLPQVIALKCHTSAIEKREASVHVAAQLLGETMQIINTLQDRELPSLIPDDLAFIDKWRAYLNHPFP